MKNEKQRNEKGKAGMKNETPMIREKHTGA
jgi:hypothetical protein